MSAVYLDRYSDTYSDTYGVAVQQYVVPSVGPDRTVQTRRASTTIQTRVRSS